MERGSSSIPSQGSAKTPQGFVDSIPNNRTKRALVELSNFTRAINRFLGDSSSLVQNALMASRYDSIAALVPEYAHQIPRNILTDPLNVLSESSRKVTPFCVSLCIVPTIFGIILQLLSSFGEFMESSNMMMPVLLGLALLGVVECFLLILYHEKKRRVDASIASHEEVMKAKRLLVDMRDKNIQIMRLIDAVISNPEQKKSEKDAIPQEVTPGPIACPICSGKLTHVYYRDPDYKLLCPSCQRHAKVGFASGFTIILVGLSAGVFLLVLTVIFIPLSYALLFSILPILLIVVFTYVFLKGIIVQNKRDIKISTRDLRNIDVLLGAGAKDGGR